MSCSLVVVAQQGDYDHFLARQFLENGEYEKAAEYYNTLLQKDGGLQYYQEYLDVLLKIKDYEKAAALVQKAYTVSNNKTYLVDLANVYNLSGDEKNANKQYQKIIKELPNNSSEIKQIAKKLIDIQQYDLAQQVYLKGRDLLKNNNAFNLEMADLMLFKNDLNAMVNAYLNEAPLRADQLNVIEDGLTKAMKDDAGTAFVEKMLLQRIGTDKNMLVYQDLLVWFYLLQHDFDGALLQAKSLDNIRNEDGKSILAISATAAQMKDYNAAIKGYQYIINKGKNNTWFVTANLNLINVQRDRIVNNTNYTKAELLSLKESYENFINNFPNNYTTINASIELAQLLALYIHETDSAIAILENIVKDPKVNKDLQAQAKLNLGDYYIMNENPWDARLIYTQVEKDFKGSPLGEEAKFRNARLSYFKGDFEFAQSQLKIIKANTSELMSNDAIDLSVFILDNVNTDNSEIAMYTFSKADLLNFQNKMDEAKDSLNIILNNLNGSSLTDDVYYLLYKIEKKQQHYEKAAAYLQIIIDDYGTDLLADNAMYYLADMYEYILNDTEKAKALYEKLILEHNDSTFVIEARKRYRKLRGDS